MELRHLRYFLAVAHEGSITEAAHKLHTTQPNISRQLADLEREIGCLLFVRDGRRLVLTSEGTLLTKRAAEIVDLAARAERELRQLGAEISGTVYLGAAETDAMRAVSRVMRHTYETHPHLRFDLTSGGPELTELLDRGLLDFAILVEPIDTDKYEYLTLPTRERCGVLMRGDDQLAAKNAVSPSDLRGKPFIVSQQTLGSKLLEGWFGCSTDVLDIRISFNLITTPAMMVEEGLGYAFTLEGLVETTGQRNICFRPLRPRADVGFYMIWKKQQPLSPPANTFLEELKTMLC